MGIMYYSHYKHRVAIPQAVSKEKWNTKGDKGKSMMHVLLVL